MQCSLLITALSVALCIICSVQCMRPVVRLPRDAERTGRYIAVLTEDASHERLVEIVEMLRNLEDCNVHGYTEIVIKAIVLDLSQDALEIVRKIPEVSYIEEEGVSYAAMLGNATGYAENLENLWYQDRIDELPREGEGIDVYILDTGIRFDHKEFENRAKYGGYDPVDQHECTLDTEDYVPMRGADCHGHGTAVASLVGGKTFGKAKMANLYSVRVIRCDTTAPSGVVIDGLEFVADIVTRRGQNAIVVLALSSVNSQAMTQVIDKLNTLSVLVVAAAGNDETDACTISPANSPLAITVGATDRNDHAMAQSNYGPCVDLFAPGQDIVAASNECNMCTGTMSGSTMSAAITAGVVAAYFSLFPHFTPAMVKERLLYQCIPNVIDFSPIPEDQQSQTPNLLLNRGCGGVVSVSDEQGVIESPDFPQRYQDNTRCKWTLVAEGLSDKVRLEFTHIILEEHYDTVKVCLKHACDEDEMIILTGDYGIPDCVLQSEGQCMTIEMTTDSFTGAPGFRAIHMATQGGFMNRCYNLSDSTIQLNVYSAGLYVGNRFSIMLGWDEIFAGRKDGINIAVIDEVNGSVIAVQHFNQRSESTKLGMFIERITYGKIVCVAVSNDGITSLSEYAKRSLLWLGSSRIAQLAVQESWALVGVKDYLGHNMAFEVSGNFPAELSTQVHLKSSHKVIFEITALSAGTNYGKYAVITVNGTVVDVPYVGYDRGMHVVALDEVTGLIVHSQVFDTSTDTGAFSSSSQFVDFINRLPNGTIVAIAIKDDGVRHLLEDAKLACESIGSVMIRRVPISGSWAIIGRKGAQIGSVPESFRSTGVSKARLVLPDLGDAPACPILINSLWNTGVQNNITVNGTVITHSTPTTKGNLIALLKDGECSVERNISFTTSDDLASFIEYIPPGRTVVVNIAYTYRTFSSYGNAALEAIGSALIRSEAFPDPWAIIGKKGAPIGSSIEGFYSGEGKALGANIAVETQDLDSVSVEAADKELGDYSRITVNSKRFTMPPVDVCGLNVVILEKKRYYHKVFNITNTSNDDIEFVQIISSLIGGTVVALGTNNAAGLNRSEEVVLAIEELGGRYISQATSGESWGMIGRKGASQGSAIEAFSDSGPIEVVSHIPGGSGPIVENDTECRILVESSATESHLEGGIRITLNGKNVNTSHLDGAGVRVALLKEDSCELEYIAKYYFYSRYNYAKYTSEIVNWINFVQPGRIVIASSFNEGSEYRNYYPETLKTAFESIGSSLFHRARYLDAWAIIGRKGATMGSVPEALFPYVSTSVSPSVTVGGVVTTLDTRSCEKELFPLECLGE